MDWRLATKGNARTIDNVLSGVKLSPLGHLAAGGVSAGMIGSAVVSNAYGKPAVTNQAPGIGQAESMNYDSRQNSALGASGDLTLALSKYGFDAR